MICPNCGEDEGFTNHYETVRGSLGLSHEEDWGMDHYDAHWLTCDACRAETDDREIKEANKEAA